MVEKWLRKLVGVQEAVHTHIIKSNCALLNSGPRPREQSEREGVERQRRKIKREG